MRVRGHRARGTRDRPPPRAPAPGRPAPQATTSAAASRSRRAPRAPRPSPLRCASRRSAARARTCRRAASERAPPRPSPAHRVPVERPAGALVHVRPLVVRPRREREPAAGPADACELACGRGRDPERRSRRKRTRRRRTRRRRTAAPRSRPRRAGRRGPRPRAARRAFASWSAEMSMPTTSAPARAARSATPPVPQATSSTRVAGPERQRFDDAIVNRREGLRDALVARAAPRVGDRPGHVSEHTAVMGDLFSDAADRQAGEVAPLAQRLRPATLGRVRRPGARARRGLGAAARDRGGPRPLARSSTARPAAARRRSRGSSRPRPARRSRSCRRSRRR